MPRQFGKADLSLRWPACPDCLTMHEPDARCVKPGVWLVRGVPSVQPGLVWLKRPMPEGQWPPDPRLPRDDSFSWWVRSHCGHPGGAKQWAFFEQRYADDYEQVFRSDPCRWTRCPHFMIENDRKGRR